MAGEVSPGRVDLLGHTGCALSTICTSPSPHPCCFHLLVCPVPSCLMPQRGSWLPLLGVRSQHFLSQADLWAWALRLCSTWLVIKWHFFQRFSCPQCLLPSLSFPRSTTHSPGCAAETM